MAHEHEIQTMSEAGGLIAGIMQDVQSLVRQQMAVFRQEIVEEVRLAGEAASYVVVGLAIVSMSSLLLSLMVVYLLALLIPSLPLWACFGIVGIPLTFLGGAICLTGIRKFSRDGGSTAEAPLELKEKYDA